MDRRLFLRQIVAPAVALGGCTGAFAGSGPPPFTHGPASMEVTSRSALVWHRANSRRLVQVEYGLDLALMKPTTPTIKASADSDYTVVAELTHLLPAREYYYPGVVLPRCEGNPFNRSD